MRSFSGIGRVAAIGAVIAAIALVGLMLFGGGAGGYSVTARFLNAGQLVKGNPVQVGAVAIGSVTGIKISDDGRAEIELEIDDEHAPLRKGTRAEIRQFSQSGLANRYVDLQLPPHSENEIPDGGLIDSDNTVTQVDLDELYNTLDEETRRSLQGFFKGSADQWRGRAEQANVGFEYLNPALSTSSRLFDELTKDTPLLELPRGQLAARDRARRAPRRPREPDRHSTRPRALGSQKSALAESIGLLPPFMRRANTTFVNLRSTLDEVDPLVDASKPVAKRLQPFLSQARAFAADAEPTVRDLSVTIRRGGRGNDLIDLLGSSRRSRTSRRPRSAAATRRPAAASSTWARPAARSRSRSPPRGGAGEIGFARPFMPPTSSAGSTTSRPPAAASTPSAPRPRLHHVHQHPAPGRGGHGPVQALPGRRRGPRRTAPTCSRKRSGSGLGCDESHRAVPK